MSNDAEVQYALGVAWSASGEGARARGHLERALRDERTRRPAALSRRSRGCWRRAETCEGALAPGPGRASGAPAARVRAGTFEVILLRRLGRRDEARAAPRLLAGRGPDAAPSCATRR